MSTTTPSTGTNLGAQVNAPFTMRANDYLSEEGGYTLKFQADGNFVMSGPDGPIWSTGTGNQGADHLEFTEKGVILIKKQIGEVIWASTIPTSNNPPYTLALDTSCKKCKIQILGAEDGYWFLGISRFGSPFNSDSYFKYTKSDHDADQVKEKIKNFIGGDPPITVTKKEIDFEVPSREPKWTGEVVPVKSLLSYEYIITFDDQTFINLKADDTMLVGLHKDVKNTILVKNIHTVVSDNNSDVVWAHSLPEWIGDKGSTMGKQEATKYTFIDIMNTDLYDSLINNLNTFKSDQTLNDADKQALINQLDKLRIYRKGSIKIKQSVNEFNHETHYLKNHTENKLYDIKNEHQLNKRNLIYHTKDVRNKNSLLLYIRLIIYILVSVLVIALIYNILFRK